MRSKAIATAAVSLAALLAPTPPAHADAAPPGFVCQAAPSAGNLTVCVKGAVQIVPTGSATGTMTGSCIAIVLGAVAATGVGCQVNALSGGSYGNAPTQFLPGSVSETHFVSSKPLQPYELCVGGNYVALDGQRGAATGWVAFGCFTTLV